MAHRTEEPWTVATAGHLPTEMIRRDWGHGREEAPKSNLVPERGIAAITAALNAIPNEKQNWDHWSRIGMAAWRSSGGGRDGLEAWRSWSAKHECHVDSACDERWKHWFRSPPTRLGFGTLYYLAREANPLFVAPYDQVFTTRDGTEYDPETGEIYFGKPGDGQRKPPTDPPQTGDILYEAPGAAGRHPSSQKRRQMWTIWSEI